MEAIISINLTISNGCYYFLTHLSYPAPLELSFRGNTPMVIGNDITVNISVSSAVPLQCELVTRGEPRMPVISEVQDCEFTFKSVVKAS